MDTTTHIAAWRELEPKPYRAHLLHVLVITHADENGTWSPDTKVGLRRALAHQGQTDGECRPHEVTTAIKHATAQGLLRHDSTAGRLILTGSGSPSLPTRLPSDAKAEPSSSSTAPTTEESNR